MQHMARLPVTAEPKAASAATFSLAAHSVYTSGKAAAVSVISVLGVPGKEEMTAMPPSLAPIAAA